MNMSESEEKLNLSNADILAGVMLTQEYAVHIKSPEPPTFKEKLSSAFGTLVNLLFFCLLSSIWAGGIMLFVYSLAKIWKAA